MSYSRFLHRARSFLLVSLFYSLLIITICRSHVQNHIRARSSNQRRQANRGWRWSVYFIVLFLFPFPFQERSSTNRTNHFTQSQSTFLLLVFFWLAAIRCLVKGVWRWCYPPLKSNCVVLLVAQCIFTPKKNRRAPEFLDCSERRKRWGWEIKECSNIFFRYTFSTRL